MNMRMRIKQIIGRAGVGIITLAAFSYASVAQASVTEKDILVIGRIIAMLNDAPKGTVTIAVAQGGGATNADIASITSIIGTGKTVGALTLQAAPTRYDQLASTPAKIVFIPDGMTQAELTKIFATAQQRKLVTISTNDTCLKIQKCAITIISDPAVDIRLSVAASAATDVAFGATFRMIVKEVE